MEIRTHVRPYVVMVSFFMCLLGAQKHTISAETWKFFFYMDASDNLTDMAFKNITDMMRGNPNQNVEIAIQLHAYENTALRYRIVNSGLLFVDELSLSGDGKQDFIEAATWALSGKGSDHVMIVFSNHGWGALDPYWNPVTESWEASEINLSHTESATCPLSTELQKRYRELHKRHKGFMFNDHEHTYLTNSDVAEALAYTQKTLLQGQKIDVVVFDTCMGSMLEVATCIAPYAQYLFGVQSCALRDGCNYQEFIAALNNGNDSRQTVAEFVQAFDSYYATHDDSGIYTCAALDLSRVNEVNNSLNNAVTKLLQHPELVPALKQARDKSPRFCMWPIYSDLVAFCKLVEEQLSSESVQGSQELVEALHGVYQASEHLVVACCGGRTTTGNAHGFSVYLPFKLIDSSYENLIFTQQSQWINLLKVMCSV